MATDLRVPVTRIADIVNEKRGITADTALGFAHYFKNSPTFWMNLQTRYDGQSANGARRINRLRVRLSATAGFVGHGWLAFVQRARTLLRRNNQCSASFPRVPCGGTLIVSLHKFPLLLVVYCSAGDFAALCIRPVCGDRASLAVS